MCFMVHFCFIIGRADYIIVLGSSTTLDRNTMHPKFDLTGVQTHDLQIMTVHFMSLRRLL